MGLRILRRDRFASNSCWVVGIAHTQPCYYLMLKLSVVILQKSSAVPNLWSAIRLCTVLACFLLSMQCGAMLCLDCKYYGYVRAQSRRGVLWFFSSHSHHSSCPRCCFYVVMMQFVSGLAFSYMKVVNAMFSRIFLVYYGVEMSRFESSVLQVGRCVCRARPQVKSDE